jgi:hypothetical protein
MRYEIIEAIPERMAMAYGYDPSRCVAEATRYALHKAERTLMEAVRDGGLYSVRVTRKVHSDASGSLRVAVTLDVDPIRETPSAYTYAPPLDLRFVDTATALQIMAKLNNGQAAVVPAPPAYVERERFTLKPWPLWKRLYRRFQQWKTNV